MTKFNMLRAGVCAVALCTAGQAFAGPDEDALTVNGETDLVTEAAAPAHMEYVDTVYSGWRFRTDETQSLQEDDFDNPSFVFVEQAEDLWQTADGSEGKSCASCHDNVEDFAGLKSTLPRVEDGELVTLTNLVNECRTDRMGAEAWKYSGGQMSAMTALIALQSRGMPMNVAIDGDAAPFWEKGKEIYYTRVGQLDMSCSNCHEDNYGNMIRADHLSQGQITAAGLGASAIADVAQMAVAQNIAASFMAPPKVHFVYPSVQFCAHATTNSI